MDAAEARQRARVRTWAPWAALVGVVIVLGVGLSNVAGRAAPVVADIGICLAAIGGTAWLALLPIQGDTKPPDAPRDGPSGTDS